MRKSPTKHPTLNTFSSYVTQQRQREDQNDEKHVQQKHHPVSKHLEVKKNPTVDLQSSNTQGSKKMKKNVSSESKDTRLTGGSWADRVRGYSVPQTKSESKPNKKEKLTKTSFSKSLVDGEERKIIKKDEEEEEGWEKVTHGKRTNGGKGKELTSKGHHGLMSKRHEQLKSKDGKDESESMKNVEKVLDVNGVSYDQETKDSCKDDVTLVNITEDNSCNILDEEKHVESNLPSTWNEVLQQYDEEEKQRNSFSWAERCESPPLSGMDFKSDENFLGDSRDTRSPGRYSTFTKYTFIDTFM